MQKFRFTEHQTSTVMKFVESGLTIKDFCRKSATSKASYYSLRYSDIPTQDYRAVNRKKTCNKASFF